jgi:hypothetical protein
MKQHSNSHKLLVTFLEQNMKLIIKINLYFKYYIIVYSQNKSTL